MGMPDPSWYVHQQLRGDEHDYAVDQSQYFMQQQQQQQPGGRGRAMHSQQYVHQQMYGDAEMMQMHGLVPVPMRQIPPQPPSYRQVAQQQQQQQSLPIQQNGIGSESIDLRTDDLFTFKDLRLGAAEFDPKNLGWLGSRGDTR
jgi:hypothetical protein